MLFINFAFGIYSAWSENDISRYGDSAIFDCIFNRIAEKAKSDDFVDLDCPTNK